MAKAEVTVAVEKAVHDAMREIAQTIWDKHGICLRNVNFSWVDVSTQAEPRLIDIVTVTREMAMDAGCPEMEGAQIEWW